MENSADKMHNDRARLRDARILNHYHLPGADIHAPVRVFATVNGL